MKTIIAGGRNFKDYLMLKKQVDYYQLHKNQITEVVSGGAAGADTLGEQYALENNIPIKVFNADWNKHGRAAGPIRNGQMAEYADAAIVIHNGSKGALNMIEQMRKLNKPVFVKEVIE